MSPSRAEVLAVHRSPIHALRKDTQPSIRLLTGLGVEGDAHCGATVQHVYAARKTPALPNLRQVHLIHAELHTELAEQGFDIPAGAMGENITTQGLDLLGLPRGKGARRASPSRSAASRATSVACAASSA